MVGVIKVIEPMSKSISQTDIESIIQIATLSVVDILIATLCMYTTLAMKTCCY